MQTKKPARHTCRLVFGYDPGDSKGNFNILSDDRARGASALRIPESFCSKIPGDSLILPAIWRLGAVNTILLPCLSGFLISGLGSNGDFVMASESDRSQ